MKRTNKFIALLLSVVMTVSLLPTAAFAAVESGAGAGAYGTALDALVYDETDNPDGVFSKDGTTYTLLKDYTAPYDGIYIGSGLNATIDLNGYVLGIYPDNQWEDDEGYEHYYDCNARMFTVDGTLAITNSGTKNVGTRYLAPWATNPTLYDGVSTGFIDAAALKERLSNDDDYSAAEAAERYENYTRFPVDLAGGTLYFYEYDCRYDDAVNEPAIKVRYGGSLSIDGTVTLSNEGYTYYRERSYVGGDWYYYDDDYDHQISDMPVLFYVDAGGKLNLTGMELSDFINPMHRDEAEEEEGAEQGQSQGSAIAGIETLDSKPKKLVPLETGNAIANYGTTVLNGCTVRGCGYASDYRYDRGRSTDSLGAIRSNSSYSNMSVPAIYNDGTMVLNGCKVTASPIYNDVNGEITLCDTEIYSLLDEFDTGEDFEDIYTQLATLLSIITPRIDNFGTVNAVGATRVGDMLCEINGGIVMEDGSTFNATLTKEKNAAAVSLLNSARNSTAQAYELANDRSGSDYTAIASVMVSPRLDTNIYKVVYDTVPSYAGMVDEGLGMDGAYHVVGDVSVTSVTGTGATEVGGSLLSRLAGYDLAGSAQRAADNAKAVAADTTGETAAITQEESYQKTHEDSDLDIDLANILLTKDATTAELGLSVSGLRAEDMEYLQEYLGIFKASIEGVLDPATIAEELGDDYLAGFFESVNGIIFGLLDNDEISEEFGLDIVRDAFAACGGDVNVNTLEGLAKAYLSMVVAMLGFTEYTEGLDLEIPVFSSATGEVLDADGKAVTIDGYTPAANPKDTTIEAFKYYTIGTNSNSGSTKINTNPSFHSLGKAMLGHTDGIDYGSNSGELYTSMYSVQVALAIAGGQTFDRSVNMAGLGLEQDGSPEYISSDHFAYNYYRNRYTIWRDEFNASIYEGDSSANYAVRNGKLESGIGGQEAADYQIPMESFYVQDINYSLQKHADASVAGWGIRDKYASDIKKLSGGWYKQDTESKKLVHDEAVTTWTSGLTEAEVATVVANFNAAVDNGTDTSFVDDVKLSDLGLTFTNTTYTAPEAVQKYYQNEVKSLLTQGSDIFNLVYELLMGHKVGDSTRTNGGLLGILDVDVENHISSFDLLDGGMITTIAPCGDDEEHYDLTVTSDVNTSLQAVYGAIESLYSVLNDYDTVATYANALYFDRVDRGSDNSAYITARKISAPEEYEFDLPSTIDDALGFAYPESFDDAIAIVIDLLDGSGKDRYDNCPTTFDEAMDMVMELVGEDGTDKYDGVGFLTVCPTGDNAGKTVVDILLTPFIENAMSDKQIAAMQEEYDFTDYLTYPVGRGDEDNNCFTFTDLLFNWLAHSERANAAEVLFDYLDNITIPAELLEYLYGIGDSMTTKAALGTKATNFTAIINNILNTVMDTIYPYLESGKPFSVLEITNAVGGFVRVSEYSPAVPAVEDDPATLLIDETAEEIPEVLEVGNEPVGSFDELLKNYGRYELCISADLMMKSLEGEPEEESTEYIPVATLLSELVESIKDSLGDTRILGYGLGSFRFGHLLVLPDPEGAGKPETSVALGSDENGEAIATVTIVGDPAFYYEIAEDAEVSGSGSADEIAEVNVSYWKQGSSKKTTYGTAVSNSSGEETISKDIVFNRETESGDYWCNFTVTMCDGTEYVSADAKFTVPDAITGELFVYRANEDVKAVKLVRGSTEYEFEKYDSNTWRFINLPAGVYNLVVLDDEDAEDATLIKTYFVQVSADTATLIESVDDLTIAVAYVIKDNGAKDRHSLPEEAFEVDLEGATSLLTEIKDVTTNKNALKDSDITDVVVGGLNQVSIVKNTESTGCTVSYKVDDDTASAKLYEKVTDYINRGDTDINTITKLVLEVENLGTDSDNSVDKKVEKLIDAQVAETNGNAGDNTEVKVNYLDLSMYLRSTTTDDTDELYNAELQVSELSSLITVYLPYDTSRANLAVYRYHVDGDTAAVDVIRQGKANANADGEYFEVDGTMLVLHLKKFSTYAVSYTVTTAVEETTHKRSSGGSFYVVVPTVDYSTCPKNSTCPISGYSDAKASEWYHDGVHYCLSKGIMNGVGTNSFAPNTTTTRVMIWTMLARLDGQTISGASWAVDARAWAMANGVSDGTNGDAAVTREQLAAMLYRYAAKKGYAVSANGALSGFGDYKTVSDWANTSVKWAVGSGIIGGDNNSRINPTKGATRAEVATMFMRFCTKVAL